MTLRKAILTTLKERKGEWVSGELLSSCHDVSRTAVWKQVKRLLEEGYIIESAPKKGYRLKTDPDILLPEEICSSLVTKRFGRENYVYYPETDSTNDRAKLLATQGYPEGTVVVAEMQRAGRGRRGRTWYSPANRGIYVSIILRPALPSHQISRIPLVTAVAVAETLNSELDLQALIKWPNDILIGGKKIAGILAEAATDMDSIEYVVVGIGLNISNDINEFPADLRMPATSVQAEQGRLASRTDILRALLYNMEIRYEQLLRGDFKETLAKARTLSMLLGQEVRLESKGDYIIGEAIEINSDGFLLVRDKQGTIRTVMSGEVDLLSSIP